MNLQDCSIDTAELGRCLGHDFHHLTRLPLQPAWPQPVREGFAAAAAAQRTRPRQDDRFVRKWLQLRLGALERGRSVATDVTVDLLRGLDLVDCPVTREPLTHGTGTGTDWSVDRLNNDGAYAASNLAVISTRANRAKGSRDFAEVLSLAQGAEPRHGLTPNEWLRLSTLMLGPCFATHPLDAPPLPLCAPLPASSLRTALQQIQRLLTIHAPAAGERNRLLRQLLPACPGAAAQARLRLLADAVHAGLKRLPAGAQCWDVWLLPGLMEALLAWHSTLDQPSWARVARTAGLVAGGRPVQAATLWPWRLDTRGYASEALPTNKAGVRPQAQDFRSCSPASATGSCSWSAPPGR